MRGKSEFLANMFTSSKFLTSDGADVDEDLFVIDRSNARLRALDDDFNAATPRFGFFDNDRLPVRQGASSVKPGNKVYAFPARYRCPTVATAIFGPRVQASDRFAVIA